MHSAQLANHIDAQIRINYI